jgi:hypothetical protein
MRLAPPLATLAAISAFSISRAAAAADRPDGPVEALACAPESPDVAAAVVDGTVWITRDGGDTWKAVKKLWLASEGEAEVQETTETSGSEEPGSSDGSDPPDPLLLAVGDRGEWAAARGERVVVDPGAGLGRYKPSGAPIAGLTFDRSSRLWIAAGDRVQVFESGRGVRTFAVAGAGSPVPARNGTVLVPGRRETFEARVHGEGGVSLRAVGRSAEAVAAVPAAGGAVMASAGTVVRIGDGAARAVARAPEGAIRLLADGDGRFWVLSNGRWSFSTAASGARPVSARQIAVDAAGRVWRGEESGPVPPRRAVGGARERSISVPRIGISRIVRAPPPCERAIAMLLPEAKLAVELGLGTDGSWGADRVMENAARSSRLFFGVTLSWALAPPPDAACAVQRERFYAREEKRRERLDALASDLADASEEVAAATTAEEALAARTAIETASARIDALGGRPVAGEQEE